MTKPSRNEGKNPLAARPPTANTLRMTRAQQMTSIAIAVPGAIASLYALAAFLLRVLNNRLELPLVPTVPAFYNPVGDAYGEGFVAGFSLCFFLTLLAVAVGTWYEQRMK